MNFPFVFYFSDSISAKEIKTISQLPTFGRIKEITESDFLDEVNKCLISSSLHYLCCIFLWKGGKS
jgi:hypothetical protein